MPGRTYSDEFKKEAVRLLETSGKPKIAIEQELGISHGLLGRWQKRFQINPVTDALELSEVELAIPRFSRVSKCLKQLG